MMATAKGWASGSSDWNPRLVVILAVLFTALVALGACWGDYAETWMNGTTL